jgi:hypothetical protein
LEGCENIFLNGVYKVTGTAIATPHGATVEFLAKEPKSALFVEGTKAVEFTTEETIRMKNGEPLSETTTTS